jgi:hypothetical protein
MMAAASFNCLVILLSASLGSKLPEGWLWAKIKEVAYFSNADFKTSLTSITVPVIPPIESFSEHKIALRRLMNKTQNSS